MRAPRVELTETELREGLTACLAVPRWVDDVVARAPFASLLELMDVAAAAATPLSAEEVGQALAQERARGQVPGQGIAAAQAAGAADPSDDPALSRALTEGLRAYEERFGRVFLLRTAGRDRPTVLAELRRRLLLEEPADTAVVTDELRDLALLRIPQLFGHLDHHSGYNDAAAAE